MNVSELFIRRPVATTLLTIGIALAGMFAYVRLPVAPLPQVDFPTIQVQAQQPGASPDTMASSVAAPLERHLGQIADVTEMTSQSSVGQTRIVLQFDLNRNIDGAARDVQAAINAARVDLPTSLRSNPTYRKVNPADAPILILALTSKTLPRGQLYDSAATVLEQSLSQVDGVGQVSVGGSALPAVRVELNPRALYKYGIGLEDVRAALAAANADSPKGALREGETSYQLYTNDQATSAAQYRSLVVAYRNSGAVLLSDVADVIDSVEDLHNEGVSNGQGSVLLQIYRQPGANVITTIERVKQLLPELKASLPADINIIVASDRSTTIRSSLGDTERALVLSALLVIAVVFLFLRNPTATLIPAVAVPVSIIGTFGAMYLLGYSLDNLSLMALTVATGFVVDDAIVVLENVSRHLEDGEPVLQATLHGAREVSFTVLSMSLSLIAVFTPILLMGGIVGRLFREFALTLSLAIVVSLVLSLTTTPMMCAALLRSRPPGAHQNRAMLAIESAFDWMQSGYRRSLEWALERQLLVALVLVGVVALNVYLFIIVPKGFFPQQDTGRITGGIQADQSISFQLMSQKMHQFVSIIMKDPDVTNVVGFTGGQQTNSGFMFLSLRPKSQRSLTSDQIIARLRKHFSEVVGARLFLQSVQDIRVGGRQGNAQYQYTLQGNSTEELYEWGPKLVAEMDKIPILTDVNSDQQQNGLESELTYDRLTQARLNLTPAEVDNTLYDAFGQRQVSTIYQALNQYHVVMEVAPRYTQSPTELQNVYVSTTGGPAAGTQTTNAVAGTVATSTRGAVTQTAAQIASDSARNEQTNSIAGSGRGSASSSAAVSTATEPMVPLAAVTSMTKGRTPLGVNHQGQFVATTISFNLAPGASLSDAGPAIKAAMANIRMPADIHGSFQGTAKTFEDSLKNEPLLIAAALLAVYVVLGVLYESYIHPITILSTLPSAGVGAVLALLLFKTEFSIIALIGVILLIGIVKKNAIMMIDFAIAKQRAEQVSARDAIFEACVLRFRPIMMTTSAAMLGAIPLALGMGDGAELRQPLGLSIVGGLAVSQLLTLYTTPVVYLYLERLRQRFSKADAPAGGGPRLLPPTGAHP